MGWPRDQDGLRKAYAGKLSFCILAQGLRAFWADRSLSDPVKSGEESATEAEDLEWQLHSREKWRSGCSTGSAWAAGTDPYDRSAFELSMPMWGPSKFGNLSAGGFGTTNGNPAYQPIVWTLMRRLSHEMQHMMLLLIIRALVWEGYADFHLS